MRPGSFSMASPRPAFSSMIRVVDIVGEIEEVVRIDVVFVDQRPQGRAVLVVEYFCRARADSPSMPNMIGDIERDPLVHLRPDAGGVRVERVVEVEDPGVHMGEHAGIRGGRGGGRGPAKAFMVSKDDNGAVAAPLT